MAPDDERIPPPARLDRMAAFLPTFEDPDFEFASRGGGEQTGTITGDDGEEHKVIQMPYTILSGQAHAFVRTAYDDGWVAPLDWGAWMRTEEAERLRDDPEAIPNASIEQCQKLLTVVIRQDRFAEGALAGAFTSGMIPAIVRRIAQVHGEAAAEGPEA